MKELREVGKTVDNQVKNMGQQDKKAMNKMAELANLMYMTNCTKQCPNKVCKARIQKSSGCNKMQCGSCKTKFCWNCSKIIDSYAHFDESPECQLYTPVHLDGDLENNEEYKRAE